jgi:ABC-type phosphate/phosphonate transport system ATPase subunit
MIEIQGIRKSFGKVEVLKGIDLSIRSGEIISVVGPSGAGKTTLLRVIQAALKRDTSTLQMENVLELELEMQSSNNSIIRWKYIKKDNGYSFVGGNKLFRLVDYNSILFGTSRGLIEANSIFFEDINERLVLIKSKKNRKSKNKNKNK